MTDRSVQRLVLLMLEALLWLSLKSTSVHLSESCSVFLSLYESPLSPGACTSLEEPKIAESPLRRKENECVRCCP